MLETNEIVKTAAEVIINIANVVSVWLAARNRRSTWIFGIIAVTLTAWLFFMSRHYMSFALNIYFMVTSVLGLIRWKSDVSDNDHGIHWGRPWLPLLFITVVTIGLYSFNKEISNDPFLDSFATAMSVVAAYLLVRQDILSWIIYIIVDIVYVYLGIASGYTEYTVIYGIMLPLAIYGTWQFVSKWKKCRASETSSK